MARFTILLACVFGLAALTAGSARAEYDSGGTPTKPAQIQANRPQPPKQIEWIELTNLLKGQDGLRFVVPPPVFFPPPPNAVPTLDPADAEELKKLLQALTGQPPIVVKPAPVKKPLPKPPAKSRPVIGKY